MIYFFPTYPLGNYFRIDNRIYFQTTSQKVYTIFMAFFRLLLVLWVVSYPIAEILSKGVLKYWAQLIRKECEYSFQPHKERIED